MERYLGVTFHEDYKRFLLEASDVICGTCEPMRITPDGGYPDLVEMVEDAWELDGVPRNLMPFCYNNGDYFCMNGIGEVVYWDHNGTNDEKWRNLAAWIEHVWINGG